VRAKGAVVAGVRHLYAERWATEMAGSREIRWRHGGTCRGKKRLTCGDHMLVTVEEKRCFGGMCKPERKMPFGKCTKALCAG
jgi:hypothetical protein